MDSGLIPTSKWINSNGNIHELLYWSIPHSNVTHNQNIIQHKRIDTGQIFTKSIHEFMSKYKLHEKSKIGLTVYSPT